MASQIGTFVTASSAAGSAPETSDAWTNPTNVQTDNASEAQITAATFDSPDVSQILSVTFDFSIPAGSTLDGMEVGIERRSIIANSGKDFRVDIEDTSTPQTSENKGDNATIWPTTSTLRTYGSPTDDWLAAGSWTGFPNSFNASNCRVRISCQANIANADVGIDFVTWTIYYTEPAVTPPNRIWPRRTLILPDSVHRGSRW